MKLIIKILLWIIGIILILPIAIFAITMIIYVLFDIWMMVFRIVFGG